VKLTAPLRRKSIYKDEENKGFDGDDDELERMKETNHVSFSPRVRVRRTLHRNNFSEAEMKACWLADYELEQLRSKFEMFQAEEERDDDE
jgi:hypothetical protein